LYFDSTVCLKCRAETGLCPNCRSVGPLIHVKPDGQKCGNTGCDVRVLRCGNFAEIGCNRLVLSHDGNKSAVCDYCSLTKIIPDLSIDGNREKWRKLERAKHRVLYMLDSLGLLFRDDTVNDVPSVSFEFKADADEPVHTGHKDGCITINVGDTNDIKREKARVEFNVPQRTLVGHFRHELGHYLWDRLVQGQRQEEFRQLFGDERLRDYGEAMKLFYANGPTAGWQTTVISAYATMHPREDFAETFGAYLDMATILDSGCHFGLAECSSDDIDTMISTYQRIGIVANELNRDMGMVDLVPELFIEPIIEKMRFIHLLAQTTQRHSINAEPSLELV